MVIVDPKKEKNAVREAKALGITTVALIDTDCDPTQIDLPIPGNDDGIRSIDLIIKQLADAVLAGRAENPELQKNASAQSIAAQSDITAEMAAKADAMA
jgi:small subunit ribosomal protein S2